MSCYRIAAVTLTICAGLPGLSLTQTVRETARLSAPGPVTILTGCECPDITLDALVSGADIVVQGTVEPLKTYTSSNERDLLTDYLITPTRMLLQRIAQTSPAPGRALSIVLTRWGGTTTLEGVQVTAVNRDVPPLTGGREYVLFLRLDKERSGTFRDVASWAGTWGVTGGIVQLLEPGIYGETFARVRGIAVDQLETELRRSPDTRIR
jgi:hypothetical protein